jgi:hypothetical protein
MAHRFAKMLEKKILQECGAALAEIPSFQITFPRPLEPSLLQALFDESAQSDNNIGLHETLHEPGAFLSLA